MTIFNNINRVPWKYVVGINAGLVALAITFTSITSINKNTENRSQASEPLPAALSTITINYNRLPALLSPEPDWAKVGDAILIKGKNLGNQPFGTIKLGDIPVPHDHLVAWEPEHIVFIVPQDAQTAPVNITVITDEGKPFTLTTEKSLVITETNKN